MVMAMLLWLAPASSSSAAQAVSVLPGGALQVAAPGGGGTSFVLRSVFTHQGRAWSGANGPDVHTLGRAASNTSDWSVRVDSSRAASGVWSVCAVGGAFRVERTVRLNGTRVRFNDTITASSTHPSLQKLRVGLLLGLQVQHILEFPTGSHATAAFVPGARWRDHGSGACDNTGNTDEFGVHTGSYGNPSVFASTGTLAAGLVPLDDVFETHAHTYQRALGRIPRQPLHYNGRTFPDCPVADPPELEIADPMLAIRAGPAGAYTQEFALYTLLEPQPECESSDYFCFM